MSNDLEVPEPLEEITPEELMDVGVQVTSTRRTSDWSDSENSRGPTSGEREFYSPPTEYDINRPRHGPLAGIDLVAYMRTGVVRRLDGRPLTEAQAAFR